jgi:hypothetical protein
MDNRLPLELSALVSYETENSATSDLLPLTCICETMVIVSIKFSLTMEVTNLIFYSIKKLYIQGPYSLLEIKGFSHTFYNAD